MRSTIQIALAAFAIMLPLVSCGGPGSGLPPLEPAVADEANYRLGPGDKLHVQVLGADDLNGDFLVGDNGTVSSPVIGDVKAVGLTRSELERDMEKQLARGYLKNPKVSVTILAYRPFYIYGEVTKPGGYPYASGMRVLSAVATAGGFTYRANQNYVVITRNGQERKAEPNSPIQPDDVIRVPQRFF
jgi:polysaccharide export outer membrane protein